MIIDFKKLNVLHSYSKEFFFVLIGQISVVLGSIIGLKVLTTFLNPAQFGEITLSLTITVFINQLIFGPLTNSVTRYYATSKKRKSFENYIQSIVDLSSKSGVLILILCCISLITLLIFHQGNLILIVLITLIYSLIIGLNSILNGVQTAARNRNIVAISQGSVVWLRFIFGIVLFLFVFKSASFVLLGYLIASILVLLLQLRYFINKNVHDDFELSLKRKESTAWQKRILNYSLPFTYWGLFTWALLSSDKWALQFFGSLKDVGLYSALYQFGFGPLLLLNSFLDQFIAPLVFERISKNVNSREMRKIVFWFVFKITGFVLGLMILVSAFLFVFHDSIFSLFVGKNFVASAYLLPYIWLAGTFFCTGQLMTIYIYAIRTSKALLNIKILNSILGISLNFLGACYWGINGIIIALLITNFLYLLSVLRLSYSIKAESN